MKKISITLLCIISLSSLSTAQEKLNINTTKSSIKWMGDYTFYFGGHEGTIDFVKGHFIKTKDKITGGSFTIDMNTIISTDMEKGEAKENLENHLKDPDFFDVGQHPFAHLTITHVNYYEDGTIQVKADLTIKDITQPVKFNATLDYDKQLMSTKFKIDRRRWNVNYTSNLRNSAISDAIGFEVTLRL